MCLNTKACAEPTAPGVWWRDGADWKLYHSSQATAIQKAMVDGVSRVDLGFVVSSKHACGARYEVDLCAMKQINLASGYTRDVKVIKAPATPVATPAATPAADDNESIKEELRMCKMSIRRLKNMVLKLESDLLAVRLEVLDNKAKGVAEYIASANQMGDGLSFNLHRASSCVAKDGVCKSCDGKEFWALEYLSEDDY